MALTEKQKQQRAAARLRQRALAALQKEDHDAFEKRVQKKIEELKKTEEQH